MGSRWDSINESSREMVLRFHQGIWVCESWIAVAHGPTFRNLSTGIKLGFGFPEQ